MVAATGHIALLRRPCSSPPRLPAVNPRSPSYTEQALAAIQQGNSRPQPETLLLASHAGAAGLFVGRPERMRALVTGLLFAHDPDLAIDRLADAYRVIHPLTRSWQPL